jgi:VWFA-related protein
MKQGLHRRRIRLAGNKMNFRAYKWMTAGLLGICSAGGAHGQAPEGPMTPAPEVKIQPGPPKIKSRSVLVNTPVTVRDAKGAMVHTLEASEFKITDNGVQQKITHFDLGGEPMSLVVVVETSSRVEPMMPQIRKSGILISQTVMGPTGEAAIVVFDDRIEKLLDFTNSADAIEKTMSRLKDGQSGARLFDAMSKAVEMLSSRPEASESDLGRRRVMLVMSEAHDAGSEDKLGEVLRRAQLANITIYAVGLSSTKADLLRKPEEHKPIRATPEGIPSGPPPPGTVYTPTTDQQGQGVSLLPLAVWAVMHAKDQVTKHQLEIAAAATGGMHVSAWKDSTIEKVIDEMGGELHAQYTLSYIPSDSNVNGYHEIQVTIDRPELKVRARPGYYLVGADE